MHTNPRMELLADRPDALPLLARLFVETWGPYYGPGGPGDAHADLAAFSRREGLPIAMVAVGENESILGVAALKPVSLPSHAHLGPWIGALVVMPEERGRGVATALIGALTQEARRQGIEMLYSDTDSRSTLLSRLGWEVVDAEVSTLRDPATVYRRSLSRG